MHTFVKNSHLMAAEAQLKNRTRALEFLYWSKSRRQRRISPFAGQLSRLKTGITSLSVSSWMWIRILGDIRVKAPPIERPELCNFWRQGGPARWGEHPDRGRGDTFVSQFMSD